DPFAFPHGVAWRFVKLADVHKLFISYFAQALLPLLFVIRIEAARCFRAVVAFSCFGVIGSLLLLRLAA
ncbi:hypothetical protein U1Q18_009766, partial [Sarracenia purpurea var. burkii]